MKIVSWTVLIVLLYALFVFAENITVVTEEYPPYNYSDNKKITGISTDVVEEVLRRAKLEYSVRIYPWSRAYKTARMEPNVLIYSIGRSQERESMFKWVGVIAPYDVYLFRLKSKTNIKASILSDLKAYNIGAVRDDVRAQYLQKEGIKLDLVSDDILNLKKLFAERIDMFPMDEMAMITLCRKNGYNVNKLEKVIKLEKISSGLYMAFSKQTDDGIVNKCKYELEEIKKDGTYNKINAKYLK